MMNHKKWHGMHHWMPMLSMVLWAVAMVSFVLGLVAITRPAGIFQISTLGWYWNALILGVLSLGCKGPKMDCESCGSCESCEMPEEKEEGM